MKKIIKKIYNLIPFKRQFFSALKKIWTPNESIYKHLHFVGVFKVLINKEKSFKIKHYGYELENEIFWRGLDNGWEKNSTKIWVQLCKTSDVIIDIGANTGIYTLIAKTLNPNAKVYAFEPVTRVFKKLKENVDLNNFDALCFEKAISNIDGTGVIYDTDSEHVYSVTVNKNISQQNIKFIETKINLITLNSFITEHQIPKIDLMKIDVETHEAEVLEGFSMYIEKFKPTILIEILNDEVGQNVEKIVKDLDYLYFNIDEKAGIRQVEKITRSDYYNYLLCSEAIAIKLQLKK
jgi:FkbM family methyltransferase